MKSIISEVFIVLIVHGFGGADTANQWYHSTSDGIKVRYIKFCPHLWEKEESNFGLIIKTDYEIHDFLGISVKEEGLS